MVVVALIHGVEVLAHRLYSYAIYNLPLTDYRLEAITSRIQVLQRFVPASQPAC